MADPISVTLSTNNWDLVLGALRLRITHFERALDAGDFSEPARTRVFVACEELRGVIEQIQHQMVEALREQRAQRYAELTAAHGTFAVVVDEPYRRLSEQIAKLEDQL